MRWKKWMAFIIAGALDIADYIAMGWLPVAGDVVDIIGVAVLYPLIGPYALLGLAELIPGEDFIPTFLIATIMSREGGDIL